MPAAGSGSSFCSNLMLFQMFPQLHTWRAHGSPRMAGPRARGGPTRIASPWACCLRRSPGAGLSRSLSAMAAGAGGVSCDRIQLFTATNICLAQLAGRWRTWGSPRCSRGAAAQMCARAPRLRAPDVSRRARRG